MNVFELQAKIGLDTSDYEKNLKKSKKSMSEYKSDVMKLAQTYKNQGLSMSDAMKKAYQDIDKSQYEVSENSERAASIFSLNWGQAGDKIQGISEKIGNGFKSVAKVVATATGAVATGIGILGKMSIASYAEYEQLAGGVQKIFDEMDSSKILDDARRAWKDLNMTANDYLTTIVDVGANFASTMGDAKGYETARRGFLAISDYASGTGKNIDVLSEKFLMITRSTSSYQSIADQFSGILPATSKDFLDQAKAVGYLDKKYKSLTEVPIAEYQEAVSLMLEKGVSALNLTGNTAAETATTITGSFAAVSATWKNLVRAFSDPGQNLGDYVNDFVDSVIVAKDNVVPRIKEMLPRIVDGLGQLIDELGPEVETLINDLLPSLIRGAAKLVADLIVRLPGLVADFASALKEALIQSLDEAGYGDIADKLEKAFDWIVENKDGIIAALKAIGGTLVAVFAVGKIISFVSAISSLFSPLGLLLAIVITVAAGIIENWDRIKWSWETMLEQFRILGDGFNEICEDIKQWFVDLGTKIAEEIESIKASYEQFKQGLADMKEGAAQNLEEVKQKFQEVKDRIAQEIESIKESFGRLKEGLAEMKQGFEDIKADVSAKFTDIKNSISESLQGAIDNASGLLNDIKSKFRDAFDNVKSTVKSAIDTIKGYMNFEWSLPHIKTPHFYKTGETELGLPIIGVSWYAKAMRNPMILNGATIFGSMGGKLLGGGEAGAEVVSGVDTLMGMIKNAVREVTREPAMATAGNTSGITIIQNIQSVPQTPVEFAATVESYFEQARWAF